MRAVALAAVVVLIAVVQAGRAEQADAGTTALAAGSLLAQDSFAGRTVSGGWGAASSGATWTLKSGTASYLSVSGNEGREKGTSSSAYENLTITTANLTDMEAVARYTTASFKDDSARFLLRYSASGTYYMAGIGSPSGAAELDVYRWSGGSKTRLCGTALSATNNTFYWVRARVQTSGSTAVLSVRAWQDGTTEPSSWQLSCTDSSPLAAGLAGVSLWDGGAGAQMDSFSVGNLSATPTSTPSPTATATNTPVPSATPTSTTFPTATATATATAVTTSTPTATAVATASPTSTLDATATPTAAVDSTATSTPVGAATATSTPVPTYTATPIPTSTATPIPTPTATPIPTPTNTPTPATPSGPVASGALFAQDTFAGRTVTGGWGTSSGGAVWALQGGTSTSLSVSGNEGQIKASSSSPMQDATLGNATAGDVEVLARYTSGSFNADDGRFLLRYSDLNDFYAVGFASPSNTAELDAYKMSGGTKTRLCGSPFSATNNTFYWERVRIQTSGSSITISARAWQDGTAEPSTWQLSCTDSSSLPAGLVGVDAWDGGAGWKMDSFSAGNLAGGSTSTSTPVATPTNTAVATPTSTTSPSPTPTATSQPDFTIAAAGDIACPPGTSPSSTQCQQGATANLLVQGHYTAVLTLGDDQYDSGLLSEFQGSYDPTWGQLKSITYPTPGNHEYNTSGAAGYYSYFGSAAGDSNKGYYSFNIGSWHFIAMNSNCSAIGGCGAGSAEETWLQTDLSAHQSMCTIAYYHHPRWSSGEGGSNTSMSAIWSDLSNAHVDLVLNGHDHSYERLAPMDANGNPASTGGTRELVVGTGGENHTLFYTILPTSQVRDSTSFGILQLTLHTSSYDWKFIPIAGNSFTDSGSGSCNA